MKVVIYVFAVIGMWFTISVFVFLFFNAIGRRAEQDERLSREAYRRMVEDSKPPSDDRPDATRGPDGS